MDEPRAGAVPIIAMTANVFREDIDRCFAAGMNDHIGKPIDPVVMMSKLRKYLGGARGGGRRDVILSKGA
jgi:CheY-like chemotaxis protein